MEMVTVFVNYGGEWDDNNRFNGYSGFGLMVPLSCLYTELQEMVAKELNLDLTKHTVSIEYQVLINGPRYRVSNDSSLSFYLQLKHEEVDKRNYPLCVEMNPVESDGVNQYNVDASNDERNIGVLNVEGQEVMGMDISGAVVSRLPTIEEMGMELAEIITGHKADIDEKNLKIIYQPNINEVKPGSIFKNKELLQLSVALYAISTRFQLQVRKSDKNEYVMKCLDKACGWNLRASKMRSTGLFKIRKIENEHTCSLDNALGDHRQATSSMIASCIKWKFISSRRFYMPGDIIDDVKNTYGVSISYDKAWRARERAIEMIRGDPTESFGNLPSYLHMLEAENPGTFTRFETDDEGKFLFSFVALGASILGWKHCRPVIVVDGTFLTGSYGGTLFTACTQDANNHIFILAYGVGDSENNKSWGWFLQRLKEAYGDREGLCFVSDRHEAIHHGILDVYPNAMHGICTYHLLQNLKKEFGKKGKGMRQPFNSAVRAYTKAEFEFHMKQLEDINTDIRKYLIDAGIERWSRAHMVTNRYSTMTSNIVESVNSVIKSAKDYPIEALFECMRCTVQKWFFNNSNEAKFTFTRLATIHEEKLKERTMESMRMKVFPSVDNVYQVLDESSSYLVNIESRSCSCKRFEVDQLPCPHAAAVIGKKNGSLYDYCSIYYTKENYLAAYCATLYPVGNKEDWRVPDEVKSVVVLPPSSRRGPGRPKEGRYKSSCENKQLNRCGRCGQHGHNQRKCKNPQTSKERSTRKRSRGGTWGG